jgi:hypothetical protein
VQDRNGRALLVATQEHTERERPPIPVMDARAAARAPAAGRLRVLVEPW